MARCGLAAVIAAITSSNWLTSPRTTFTWLPRSPKSAVCGLISIQTMSSPRCARSGTSRLPINPVPPAIKVVISSLPNVLIPLAGQDQSERCLAWPAPPLWIKRGCPHCLRKQLFSGLRIFDDDCAHRAVLGGLKDLLFAVAGGVDRFRLAIVVEPKHIGRKCFAHRIADAEEVVNSNAQLARHRPLLLPMDRQRF